MRLLLVHANSLDNPGGAELSLNEHLAAAPPGIQIDVVLPDDPVVLEKYDTVILANLRPSGGLGEKEEFRWARLWARRLKGYCGYVIKSERDVHPCARRDGRCIQTEPLKRVACNCGSKIPSAFEKLYNLCDAVQFLSPLHRRAINLLIRIKAPRQYEVGSPIDFNRFRSTIPFHQRKHAALLTGDTIRVAPDAVALAEAEGYPVERVGYLSVPYGDMPDLLNRYKAVVVAPMMLHGFGRLAVEALACGCRVIANKRVGALSWPDPIHASQRANEMFWKMVTDRPVEPNPRRFNRLAFWRF
jgi:hypothetical protein